jgi:hypothetical protein
MKTNTKTTLWVMLICTPIGWVWEWIHYQAGAKSGWIFPPGSWFGIEFGGMVVEDWFFIPITGFFFLMWVLFDLFKRMFGRYFPLKRLSVRRENVCKYLLYTCLCVLLIFSVCFFGLSGNLTSVFFGLPCVIILPIIWKQWDIYHFLRTGLIVVPMEFIWDHIAVGVFNQWVYIHDAGIWGDLWFRNIPIEMTPYLGIMSWYFIFSMVVLVKSRVEN